MSAHAIGVLDTSALIGLEAGREVNVDRFPETLVTTVITFAEIEAGILAASDVQTRAERLATWDKVRTMPLIAVTREAAHEWARLRTYLRAKGRRMEVNDLWIAAVAAANRLPIVTQDADFEALHDAPGVEVIRV